MTKAHKSIVPDVAEDAVKATQVLFTLNPVYAPQARHFWQAQERFLQEAEKFSSAWFKRRHEATRSALDLAARIATDGLKDPAVMMTAMTDWQTHSMERLAEDAKDCTEMMTRSMASFVSNEIEAVEESAENTLRVAKERHATPV